MIWKINDFNLDKELVDIKYSLFRNKDDESCEDSSEKKGILHKKKYPKEKISMISFQI